MNFTLFLKGILMGICDIIPGISGGTIAFITGIYSRLINAVKSFSPKLAGDFFRAIVKRDKQSNTIFKKDIRKLDLKFLITLGAGIAAAFLIGARIIGFLLEYYFVYTILFFIGLILASSIFIFNSIENHSMKNVLFGFFGLLFGLALAIVVPAEITPNLTYVFFGGFLAISAMFLPGISGAFILLIMGLYEFMIGVLHNPIENFAYFLVFIIGAGLGAFVISRVISFLFRKDECKTLYFLLGLVIGALNIPLRRVFESDFIWTFQNIFIVIFLAMAGGLLVMFVQRKNVSETGN